MTKDEILLVKIYEKTKADLILLTKHEKMWNCYNHTIVDPDFEATYSEKQINDMNEANKRLADDLTQLGYSHFNDKEKFQNDFYTLTTDIVNKIEQTIISVIPKTYNAEYCNVYKHYETQMALIYAGDGFCHSSFINDKGTKYCVSPHGYVFKSLQKFGRILKDGSIKKGKLGRFGNIEYE